MTRKGVIVLGCTTLLLVGGYYFLAYLSNALVHHVPPENYTSTGMYPLKIRILRFANNNNRLPHNLQELPELEGFTNRTKDYWGNELIMKPEGSKIILISYGKDMIEGGVNDNLDVIGVFDTKTVDGSWASEKTNWLSRPIENNGVY